MKIERVTGIITLLGVVLMIIFSIWFINGRYIGTYYTLRVRFAYAGMIKKGANVKFQEGVTIGYVADIHQIGQRVELLLKIKKKIKIKKNAEFRIYDVGLIGERYINVYQPDSPAPYLEPGSIVEGVDAVGVEVVRQHLSKLLAPIVKKTSENPQRLDKSLNSSARSLQNINYLICKHRKKVINNINYVDNKFKFFLKNYKKNKAHLDYLVKKLRYINQKKFPGYMKTLNQVLNSGEQLKTRLNELEKINSLLNKWNDQLTKNKYIQMLVFDEDLYNKIEKLTENIKNKTEKILEEVE